MADDDDVLEVPMQDVLRLCQVLFQSDYLPQVEPDLKTVAKAEGAAGFAAWFQEFQLTATTETVQHYCEMANTDTRAWAGLTSLLSDIKGVLQLIYMWPQIVLAGNELRHEVEAVGVCMLVRWKNGRSLILSQMSMASHLGQHADGTAARFTDGNIMTFVAHTLPAIQELLIDPGLDKLCTKVAYDAGLQDIRLLLSLVNRQLGTLTEEERKRVLNMESLLAGFFCPHEVQRGELGLPARDEPPPAASGSSDLPQGGWDG